MKVVVDRDIPFAEGRLERCGVETVYAGQWEFTPDLVRDADALVIRTRTRCDRELLEGSSVKLVATATIGTDQIDTEWCRNAGIEVRNAPGCNAPGVAQYVWASLLKHGFDPRKDTLGIVGCGNVGGIVKEWGERLGARILVNDPPKEESREPRAENRETMDFRNLGELLGECDAVTLHTPLVEGGRWPTRHLIGEIELGLLRDGAMLVNASRGPVVDGNALKRELRSGRLRGVVDTWEGEPEIDRELLGLVEEGTFHIAGYSRQGKERATRMALEAVGDVLGIEVDLSGLEGPYPGVKDLSAEKIVSSYDPGADTAALRKNPGDFDKLRAAYNYREET